MSVSSYKLIILSVISVYYVEFISNSKKIQVPFFREMNKNDLDEFLEKNELFCEKKDAKNSFLLQVSSVKDQYDE